MKIVSSTQPQLRHIVDVDGLLIGIEPASVSTTMLQALAGVRGKLAQVFGDHEFPLAPTQTIALKEDEILFFRSDRTPAFSVRERRLAA